MADKGRNAGCGELCKTAGGGEGQALVTGQGPRAVGGLERGDRRGSSGLDAWKPSTHASRRPLRVAPRRRAPGASRDTPTRCRVRAAVDQVMLLPTHSAWIARLIVHTGHQPSSTRCPSARGRGLRNAAASLAAHALICLPPIRRVSQSQKASHVIGRVIAPTQAGRLREPYRARFSADRSSRLARRSSRCL